MVMGAGRFRNQALLCSGAEVFKLFSFAYQLRCLRLSPWVRAPQVELSNKCFSMDVSISFAISSPDTSSLLPWISNSDKGNRSIPLNFDILCREEGNGLINQHSHGN
jgi:hypothetical protein